MNERVARFEKYWRATARLGDRLIADTAIARDMLHESLSREPAPDRLVQIKTALERNPSIVNPAAAPTASLALPSDGGKSGGELFNNDFLSSVRRFTQELLAMMSGYRGSRAYGYFSGLLSLNQHSLAERFGSFTAMWDYLVALKFEIAAPDGRHRKLDAWFIALVGLTERFIRDVIGLTVQLAGRQLVEDAVLACFDADGLGVPTPTPSQLLRFGSTEEALADTVRNFMDRGARHTTGYASHFARALGFDLYPDLGAGFRPGLLSGVPVFTADVEHAWSTVLDLRKAMVHETAPELRNGLPATPREELYQLRPAQLELVADTLCAFGVGFAVRMLAAVAERARPWADASVTMLQGQYSGEFRFRVMQLLMSSRYALAWAIAEVGLLVEPADRRGIMLRLNAYFARQQLGRDDSGEIEALAVDEARYVLLKNTLLGRLAQNIMQPILESVLRNQDVTMGELVAWPALARLRAEPWWSDWASGVVRNG